MKHITLSPSQQHQRNSVLYSREGDQRRFTETSEKLGKVPPGTLGQIVQLIPGRRQKVKLIIIPAGKKTNQRQFASAQGSRLGKWFQKVHHVVVCQWATYSGFPQKKK